MDPSHPPPPADLTKSFVAGFRNAKAARRAWDKLAQESDRAERDRKMRVLKSNFPDVNDQLIEQALEQANWDIDDAIIPLFQAIEKEKSDKQRQQLEEERELRKKDINDRANAFLSNLFSQIPKEKIQEMLDENEGDIDTTTDQLLKLVREEEEKQKKENAEAAAIIQREKEKEQLLHKQIEKERQTKVRTCVETFEGYLSEEEIRQCLEMNDWDLSKVTLELLEKVEHRKVDQLHRIYKPFDQDQVRTILEQENWDMVRAMLRLRELQNEKRKPKVEVSPPILSDEEVVVDDKVPSLPTTTVEPDTLSKEKHSENLLLRSVAIAKELNDRVIQQDVEENDFKNALREKLRFGPDDVPGCRDYPGLIPLTPQIIDNMQPLRPFNDESQHFVKVSTDEEEDLDNDLLIVSDNGQESKVTLKVHPDKFDVGTSITVEWENMENSTSSDWLGLYLVDSPVKQYIKTVYVEKNKRKGTVYFTPSDFGKYNVRYFTSGYNLLATSETVSVGPQYDVDASYNQLTKIATIRVIQRAGKVYPNLWVGMYEASQTDNKKYYTYEWMSKAVDNSLPFVIPKVGEWEFRLFPLNNYNHVTHVRLSVRGQDELLFVLEGTKAKVQYNIQTVDLARESVWVGIYLAEETNDRMYKKYKTVPNAFGEITFNTPLPSGSYDARVLTGYERRTRSNTVIVPFASN